MAKKHPHSSRYARLVAGFAASAFALLGALSIQLHQAGTVSAEVAEHAAVITNYRQSAHCIPRVNKNQRTAVANYRICRSK